MAQPIEYQHQFMEIVFINLPGPAEPEAGMSGGELLHGFLANLYTSSNPELKPFIMALASKWNVQFRQTR